MTIQKDVTQKIRELLILIREVEEWREEQDPGTPEWLSLCGLAEQASDLIFSLPTELLPEEELRTPAPAEAPTVDELLKLLNLD
ncbi:hypothetical protein [Streptomyces asiaticus]|uniref:hypothetical protein n=1 Tax=Streptomyces asiaticus TaxID=114695 RepID=UPI003F679065